MRIVDKGKDMYWGWFIVTGAFLILAASYGTRYSFGVFVRPMFVDNQWQMSAISVGFSINLLIYALSSLVSGRLIDRMAPRWIMTIGACIAALGFILTGFVRTPGQLYITYGVLCGMGSAGIGVVVSSASVGKWFVRRRGIAIGVASIGIGLGTMALTPVAGYIVKNYHWRTGFIFLGIIVLIVGVLVSQVLMRKSRPEQYGLLPDGDLPETRPFVQGEGIPVLTYTSPATVLKDHHFWIIVLCFSGAIMAQMMVFVHQVSYAVDNNIGRIAAASSLGAIGVASIFGRFFFGWLSDQLNDPKYSALLGYIIMASGMFILLNIKTSVTLYIYALVFGFGYGSLAPMMPVLLSDRFGRDVLGSAYGFLTFFSTGIGGAIGPVLGGIIYDTTGSYNRAWYLNIFILIFISLLMCTLKTKRQLAEAVSERRE
ncbi:MAG TPA: MFS transporter [Syntrophales bacterium]|nr:MFS transporter [Syntrophales bacterium]HPQ44137.1 MFS transporter [Syntrophales bacterium]